jgi:hypothetical protein
MKRRISGITSSISSHNLRHVPSIDQSLFLRVDRRAKSRCFSSLNIRWIIIWAAHNLKSSYNVHG